MSKLGFIPLTLFLLLVAALSWHLIHKSMGFDASALESALIGKPVPVFHLSELKDREKFRNQTLMKQGHPVLLNLWASWCPACMREHNFLMKLAAQGIPIIGVDYKDSWSTGLNWLHVRGNPYAITLVDHEGSFGLDLGVYGVPETFLIDGNGIVRWRHAGIINEKVWRDELAPLWEKYSKGQQ